MNLKRKAGIIMVLVCMAAILAVVWYCLFAASRQTTHVDGTFVKAVTIEEEIGMAA